MKGPDSAYDMESELFLKSEMIHIVSDCKSNLMIQDSLAGFRENQEYLDLELRCEKTSIQSHKFVMSFSPMIKQCLQEFPDENENVIIIFPDFDHDALEAMVNNLYASLSSKKNTDFYCDTDLAKELLLHQLKQQPKTEIESANNIQNRDTFQCIKQDTDIERTIDIDDNVSENCNMVPEVSDSLQDDVLESDFKSLQHGSTSLEGET